MTPTIDLDAIEAGARAVPEDARDWCTDDRYPGKTYCDDDAGTIVADCGPFSHVFIRHAPEPIARHIANMDPPTALALCARLREAEESASGWQRAARFILRQLSDGDFRMLCVVDEMFQADVDTIIVREKQLEARAEAAERSLEKAEGEASALRLALETICASSASSDHRHVAAALDTTTAGTAMLAERDALTSEVERWRGVEAAVLAFAKSGADHDDETEAALYEALDTPETERDHE